MKNLHKEEKEIASLTNDLHELYSDVLAVVEKSKSKDIIQSIPIKDVGFSRRIFISLRMSRIFTLGQLIRLPISDLMNIHNLRENSIKDIFRKVLNLCLDQDKLSKYDIKHGKMIQTHMASSPLIIETELPANIQNILIEDVKIPIKLINALKRSKLDIRILGQFTTLIYYDFLGDRNIVEGSIEKIRCLISEFLSLSNAELIKERSKRNSELFVWREPPLYLLTYKQYYPIDLFIKYGRANSILFHHNIFTIIDFILNWEKIKYFQGVSDWKYENIIESFKEPSTILKDTLRVENIENVINKIGNFPIAETSLKSNTKDLLHKNGFIDLLSLFYNFHLFGSQFGFEQNVRKEIITHILFWLRNPKMIDLKAKIHVTGQQIKKEMTEFEPEEGVEIFLARFSNRELQRIITLYGFLDSSPKTLRATAEIIGVTGSTIRKTKLRVINKHSNYRYSYYLLPFFYQLSKWIKNHNGLISAKDLESNKADLFKDFKFQIHPFLQFLFDTNIEKEIYLPIEYIKEFDAYISGISRKDALYKMDKIRETQK